MKFKTLLKPDVARTIFPRYEKSKKTVEKLGEAFETASRTGKYHINLSAHDLYCNHNMCALSMFVPRVCSYMFLFSKNGCEHREVPVVFVLSYHWNGLGYTNTNLVSMESTFPTLFSLINFSRSQV